MAASSEALPDDFAYDAKAFAREPPAHELPPSFAPLYHSFAFESHKRSNLHYLNDDTTLCFAAGSIVHFLDVSTMELSYLPSPTGSEVGCIETHKERSLLCVAEKGVMPNVFIYEYPSLSLIRVLKGGTERAYSAAHFSADGTKLATVGSFPDYMITVWDWHTEAIILRTKAFSQEVYRVRFSPRFDGQLVTGGTGHIRFWRMAQTFTGLKLQGDIGKFGQVELSDIEGYCELPDGKILSGSYWGNLLLWEGNLIKCEIRRSGGGSCHDGGIGVVILHGSSIVTGGNDGCVRTWPLGAVETAEPTDEVPIFEMSPLSEVRIDAMEAGRKGAKVQTMLQGDDHWIVQDSMGGIYKIELDKPGSSTSLFTFHAGPITGLDLCPFNHAAVTCGADGSVRLWDYVAKAPLTTFRSPSAATTLVWAGRAVDPEGRSICVGYADGVVRVLTRCKDGLTLKTAFKPHTVGVAALAYSTDGAHLATGAADGTVFFITVRDGNYRPLGFMPPPPGVMVDGKPAAVTALSWASEEAVLVGYADGSLFELALPTDVDTSETFQLPSGGVQYDATPIVEQRRAAVKAAKAAKAPPAPAPAQADEFAAPAEAEPAPEEEPEPDFVTGAVTAILPLTSPAAGGRTFYVAYANEAGCMWHGTWGEGATKVQRHDAPTVGTRLSHSSTYLLTTADDGSMSVGEAGSAADSYWHGRVHGAGPQLFAQLSFDDTYLVSAGADGNVFVHKLSTGEHKDHILSTAGLPSTADGFVGSDITDPASYSIEEAKQKQESDAKALAAEEAKLTVREKVERVRAKFSALLDENASLPPAEQLARDAFYIDPGLAEETARETQQRLADAQRELAWISERTLLSRTKLEETFLRQLAVESMVLYDFANRLSVRSFRTVELEAWQKEAMEYVHTLIEKEQKSRRKSQTVGGTGDAAEAADKEDEGPADVADEARAQPAVSKMQERLARRQARSKEWAAFNATKPDEKYEDPVDVHNIQYAETHMGNFSLKTDEDYVVPESQRVNAQKKRRQIVLLEESIHAIVMGFNERFLALKDLKSRLIASMTAGEARLHEINRELALSEPLDAALVAPSALAPEEQPEVRVEVTPGQLATFKVEQEEAKAKAKGGGGGFGGGMAGAAKAPAPSASTSASPQRGRAAGQPAPSAAATAGKAAPTELEEAEALLGREHLVVEKSRLLERRRQSIGSFNAAVGELRAEKLRLQADLKTTDLRKLVLFRELLLLKEFEKKDIMLNKRLETKHHEKTEIVQKVADCHEKLTSKKAEMERLLERDRQIMAEFQQAIGENSKFHDELFKIFKRKIKRKRQVQGGGDDDDSDEDEDEEEDDDDDEDDDEEEVEETCPPGCEPSLYDKVCELREKRLDQEEVYTEFQKGIEALKKENDMLIKKEKAIDTALKTTEVDIHSFHSEKQRKLNELHVVVTLSMSQVRHVDANGQLPADLTKDLIFPSKELDGLGGRIKTIQGEKADLRKRQKSLRIEYATIKKELAVKAGKLDELDARARDVQMLKFGRLIDLERIESVGVNKAAEELHERIKAIEISQAATLRSWQEKLKITKNELKEATEESTTSLNTVASLFERQHALETSLNTKQAQVAPKEPGKERKERTSLVQLVKIQAKEVEALKLEINMLRRKGGHVYTGSN